MNTVDHLITQLGKEGFRGLHYNKELLNDGLQRMMWTVTFILNNDVVITEPSDSPTTVLSVAITARREAQK